MKRKIVLRRFFHRGKWRISISFAFDAEINDIARSLPGGTFSSTQGCWYVDNSEESLKEILRAFKGKADVDISAISTKRSIPGDESVDRSEADDEQSSEGITGDLAVERSYEDKPGKLIIERGKAQEKVSKSKNYAPVEFRIDDRDGRLVIKFTGRYDSEWIDEIRSYGRFYYDKTRREFLLQWSQLTTDSLADYFSSRDIEVRVIKTALPGRIREEREETGNEVRLRELNKLGVEGIELLRGYLKESRYSDRTVESYVSQLEVFFKFFNNKDPLEITHNELSDFVSSFIIRLGFSSSYQNQMISAVKLFYEISGRGRIIPQVLERPRRSRALPKVFSKEEVTRILGSVRNDKHKLLLWMIYSCGLRRSEVINIRLKDLDRDRSILHIREGKGRVDRVVPVSDKVWAKIDVYIPAFRPMTYLFEGQGGGKYSAESVYNVFKGALRQAGIRKDVGVHSLRHSYATHLHESGLDIRYIQELLGHRSSRTTEIYTHVSRRNLVLVRSPIEDLDVG